MIKPDASTPNGSGYIHNADPQFAQFLFTGVEALLVESPDSESWEIIADEEFGEKLIEFGLIPTFGRPSRFD